MSAPRDAAAVLDQEYLEVRGKILEVAAALDRLELASGQGASPAPDGRAALLRRGLELLLAEPAEPANRAKAVQLAFSLPYQDGWLEQLRPGKRGS